jgi:uncharacterized protein YndB with AHSA1/START domain
MPETTYAVLQDHAGRSVLRFERILAHPPERVWQALSDRDELSAWHPTPFALEPTLGGVISYVAARGAPAMPAGEVTAYEPPRLLAHTWGEDSLRWEVRPHPAGSKLTLTHTFEDRFKAARDAAGWHLCLDALSSSLDGANSDRETEGERLPSGWRELNGEYERRFGIPAEQATPPPPP